MDFKTAEQYWQEQARHETALDRDALLAEIQRFAEAHNTCALATGYGDFVRCTPIEYTYLDGKFWMLSEGGLKFRGLEKNANVCLAIFDPYNDFGKLGGLQVSGRAELVEPWSAEYLALLEHKKIPAESLKKIPHPLYLIRVTPVCVDFLCTALREKGVSARQHLNLEAE